MTFQTFVSGSELSLSRLTLIWNNDKKVREDSKFMMPTWLRTLSMKEDEKLGGKWTKMKKSLAVNTHTTSSTSSIGKVLAFKKTQYIDWLRASTCRGDAHTNGTQVKSYSPFSLSISTAHLVPNRDERVGKIQATGWQWSDIAAWIWLWMPTIGTVIDDINHSMSQPFQHCLKLLWSWTSVSLQMKTY